MIKMSCLNELLKIVFLLLRAWWESRSDLSKAIQEIKQAQIRLDRLERLFEQKFKIEIRKNSQATEDLQDTLNQEDRDNAKPPYH